MMHLLCALRGRYTPLMQRKASEGTLTGAPIKIQLRRQCSLPACVSTNSNSLSLEQVTYPNNIQSVDTFFQHFSLLCAKCRKTRRNSRILPTNGKSWITIKCDQDTCDYKAPAHAWLCNCGCNWRNCQLHHQWPIYATNSRKRSMNSPSNMADTSISGAGPILAAENFQLRTIRLQQTVLGRNPRLAAKLRGSTAV